jgi:hypothetical protein
MSEPHRFRFRRGELEIEFEGDRDFVEAQLAQWLPRLTESAPAERAPKVQVDVTPAAGPEGTGPGGAPMDSFRRVPADYAPKVTITLEDFVKLKEAVAPVDLVTVAGYYMEKYRRQERYTPDELEKELAALSEWGCANVDEPFELAVESGYFEQLRDGQYTLTYKGQTYVQNGLSS